MAESRLHELLASRATEQKKTQKNESSEIISKIDEEIDVARITLRKMEARIKHLKNGDYIERINADLDKLLKTVKSKDPFKYESAVLIIIELKDYINQNI